MPIRSTAKALIVHNGKVLLNKFSHQQNSYCYTLPGGGQHLYETLHEAIVRECLEETGYTVVPVRLAALCESIWVNDEMREQDTDFSHRMYHIFLCSLACEEAKAPTEKDAGQIGYEWVDIDSLTQIKLLPGVLGENIHEVLEGTAPVFLGSEYIRGW